MKWEDIPLQFSVCREDEEDHKAGEVEFSSYCKTWLSEFAQKYGEEGLEELGWALTDAALTLVREGMREIL